MSNERDLEIIAAHVERELLLQKQEKAIAEGSNPGINGTVVTDVMALVPGTVSPDLVRREIIRYDEGRNALARMATLQTDVSEAMRSNEVKEALKKERAYARKTLGIRRRVSLEDTLSHTERILARVAQYEPLTEKVGSVNIKEEEVMLDELGSYLAQADIADGEPYQLRLLFATETLEGEIYTESKAVLARKEKRKSSELIVAASMLAGGCTAISFILMGNELLYALPTIGLSGLSAYCFQLRQGIITKPDCILKLTPTAHTYTEEQRQGLWDLVRDLDSYKI